MARRGSPWRLTRRRTRRSSEWNRWSHDWRPSKWSALGGDARDLRREPLQQSAPAVGRFDRGSHRHRIVAHPLEMPMFEIDARDPGRFRREADLDLARFGEVGLI